MKKLVITNSIFLVILVLLTSNISNAQTGLNFQGVARSSNNVIIASQQISLRLSILQGSATGSVEYSETRKVTTNAQGLFAVVIGDADATSAMGSFNTINWKNTPKYLKIEMDANAGNNYTTIGTTQFQYVAYAQFASSVDAENIVGVVPVARGGTGATNLTTFKSSLVLDKINNTSDADKPISTKTQTALDLKLNAADTSKYTKQSYTDAALLTKFNYADTGKYTKQLYTDSSLVTKLKLSDTASMLSNRIGKDTLNLSARINAKANTSDVNTVLALKANTIDINTSLGLKANSSDVVTSLSSKVDKVTGKELSTNDYSNVEKAKLAAITGTNTGDQDLSSYATNTTLALKANTADINTSLTLKANSSDVVTSLSSKVDKVTGKELSTNDYSNVEKAKLAAITGTNTGDQDLSSYATNTTLALKANTADINTSLTLKANSSDVVTSLSSKVNKVTGKELSTNDYSNAEKAKLAAITGTNTGDQDLSSYTTNTALALKANASDVNTSLGLKANSSDVVTSLSSKVDKVTGKELSTNDYSNAEKAKLAAITGTNTGDQDLSSYATNTALALKANTADVNTSLSLKANASDVTSSLALKENTSNKSSAADLGGTSPSDILYPTQKAVKDYVTANASSGGVVDGGITTIKLADGAVTDAKIASGISKSKVGLGNVENTALSTWAGSNNLTTVGTITSGTWSGTAIALSNGGTGATNATAARANLGLVIGANVQAPLVAGTDYQIPLTAGTSYIVPNSAITGATKTKITYDTKGLITVGADATTADIASSTNRNYVTDVQAGVISNTSGVNTGDETTSSIKSKLGITTLSGSNTGDQTNITGNAATATKLSTARNINGVAFDGSGDIAVTADAGTLTGTILNATVTGSSLTSVGTLANLTVTNPIAGSITGNAATAGNITATSNTTLTSVSNLNTVGTITSGVWSGTTVAVEKGGTGATNAAQARANLGLVIGANVQAPLVAGTDYQIPLTAGTSYIVPNSAITGATKTKITYDTKGLITVGADATTADIASSTNRNYVTDVQAGVISNTSGVNTGDETTSSIKSKLGITTLSGSNTGDQTNITGNAATATKLSTARNINGVAFDGSGDIAVTADAGTLTGTILNATVTGSSLTSVGTLANLTVTNPIAGSITGNAATAGNITATSNTTLTSVSNLNTVGTITSGVWSGTTVAVEKGGTGATNAAQARANLGLVIGANVQAPLVAGTDYQIPLTAGTSYIVPNSAITGATKTKITYDTKGLITVGADATTADIASSTNRNYVTDVQAGVISNTSGVNTGDETTSSIKSKLGITTLSGSNTGDQTNITGNAATATKLSTARNINGVAFDGSGDIAVTADAGTLTGTILNATVTGSSLTSVGTLANLTVTNPIAGSITGNAATAGNITATSNTTLTSVSNLNTVGTITSGVWSGTTVAVEKGGTGATNAAQARANLGLVIGANVQAPLVAGTDYQIPLTAGTSYIVPNSAITGATKTKITYDTKGLITVGADATTADIASSTNRNYVTDVQAGVISNTSGVNTGDETTSSIKSKLGITTLSGSNTGDQVLPTLVSLGAVPTSRVITINGTGLDLSSDRSYTINTGLTLADLESSNVKAKTFELTQPTALNSTTTTTLDLSSGNLLELVLTGPTTLAFSNPKIGTYIIKVKQDGTGGRTLTFPIMKWSDAAVPTITTAANAIDLITLIYDGTHYYGSCLQNF